MSDKDGFIPIPEGFQVEGRYLLPIEYKVIGVKDTRNGETVVHAELFIHESIFSDVGSVGPIIVETNIGVVVLGEVHEKLKIALKRALGEKLMELSTSQVKECVSCPTANGYLCPQCFEKVNG